MLETFDGFQVDPTNIPLPRAGIYRVRESTSRKTYIGISKNLLIRSRPHASGKGSGKLANAIRKHGAANFLFEPIFYCLPHVADFSFLPQLEAEMIIEYDSIQQGYNIIEACGRIGPYGAEFAKLIAESHAKRTPEERSAIIRKGKLSMDPIRLSEIGKRNALSVGVSVLSVRMRELQLSRTGTQRQESARAAGLASANAARNNPALMALRVDHGRKLAAMQTTEDRRERYSQGIGLGGLTEAALSQAGSKGAAAANANRTPEERKQLSQKAAQARYAKMTPEERQDLARKAGLLGGATHAAKSYEERCAIARKVADSRRKNGTNETPTKGSRWINDGQSLRRLKAGDVLPDGWTFGHLGKKF